MVDYRPEWDEAEVALSRELFDKHMSSCTPGERKAVLEILAARTRLSKLDAFLRQFQ